MYFIKKKWGFQVFIFSLGIILSLFSKMIIFFPKKNKSYLNYITLFLQFQFLFKN